MGLLNYLKTKIKHLLCKQELEELYRLKQTIEEVKVWCSRSKEVVAVTRYLQDSKDYPCQLKGAHGSIEDFTYYLEKISDKRLFTKEGKQYDK